ncbi:hypothetical protein EAJ04_17185 [Bacteroides faecis]|nr:hypothetical protein EAJ04_17185 [Bacteroides faecis]
MTILLTDAFLKTSKPAFGETRQCMNIQMICIFVPFEWKIMQKCCYLTCRIYISNLQNIND